MHIRINQAKKNFARLVTLLIFLCFLPPIPSAQFGGGSGPPPKASRLPLDPSVERAEDPRFGKSTNDPDTLGVLIP
jgi:hypothetical protein